MFIWVRACSTPNGQMVHTSYIHSMVMVVRPHGAGYQTELPVLSPNFASVRLGVTVVLAADLLTATNRRQW